MQEQGTRREVRSHYIHIILGLTNRLHSRLNVEDPDQVSQGVEDGGREELGPYPRARSKPPNATPSEADTEPELSDVNLSEVEAEGPSSDREDDWSRSTSHSRSYEDLFAYQEQEDTSMAVEWWDSVTAQGHEENIEEEPIRWYLLVSLTWYGPWLEREPDRLVSAYDLMREDCDARFLHNNQETNSNEVQPTESTQENQPPVQG